MTVLGTQGQISHFRAYIFLNRLSHQISVSYLNDAANQENNKAFEFDELYEHLKKKKKKKKNNLCKFEILLNYNTIR